MLRRWVVAGVLGLTVGAGARAQELAITVDDLPAHEALPPGVSRLEVAQQMLQTLKREKMPRVYGFINAKKLEAVPEDLAVLRAWRAAGEPLGNHTYSHGSLETMTPRDFEEDIARNEEVLRGVGKGADWHWFRYPYLHEGETAEKHRAVRAWLKAHGYRVAEVSLDFEDYLWNAPYARCSAKGDDAAIAELERTYLETAGKYVDVFRKLNEEVYGRQIPEVLLLHIGAFDARMLPKLIALLREKGYRFVTLEKAEKDKAYAEDPAENGAGGGALQELVADERNLDMPDETKPYELLDGMCR